MLASTAALAQQSSQLMMSDRTPGATMYEGWGYMMGPGMMGRGMMPMMMYPSQHVEGRLAFLKTELKITDTEVPQWNAYADAVRANGKRMGEIMNQMMSGGTMMQGRRIGRETAGLS